jgi:hypothetical protein
MRTFVVIICILLTRYSSAANIGHCAKAIENGTKPFDCHAPDIHCSANNPKQPRLELSSCIRLCGHGFKLDNADDILARFLQWLLPVSCHSPCVWQTFTLLITETEIHR